MASSEGLHTILMTSKEILSRDRTMAPEGALCNLPSLLCSSHTYGAIGAERPLLKRILLSLWHVVLQRICTPTKQKCPGSNSKIQKSQLRGIVKAHHSNFKQSTGNGRSEMLECFGFGHMYPTVPRIHLAKFINPQALSTLLTLAFFLRSPF